MRVPTANIVVAFNKETIERLFSAGATATSLMSTLSNDGEDKAILFNSESNPNFISFEHDNGMSPGMKMKLVFIDPKGEFEKRYLSDSMLDNMAGYGYAPEDQQPTILGDRKNKQLKAGLAEYTKEYIDEFAEKYTAKYGTKEIYVAYGSGENLSLWSGPHRTVLQAADIAVKGARKISLTLAPTPRPLSMGQRRGAFNEPVNLDLRGATMRYSGESKPIYFSGQKYIYEDDSQEKTTPYDPLDYLNLHTNAESAINTLRDETKQSFGALGFEDLVSTIGDFDLHSLVVDTLRNYIQTATSNPNVIVLLPNINLICRKIIDSRAKNARLGIKPEKATGEAGSNTFNQIATNFGDSTQEREVGKKREFIRDFLSDLGLSLFSVRTKESIEAGILAQAEILKYKSVEKARSAIKRFLQENQEREYFASLQKSSSKGIPNHMELVTGVINSLTKLSEGEYPIELTCFNETDINVLNHWATKGSGAKHYPLFGGYHKFNEKQEAVIFGDLGLIRNYLYAEVNLDQEAEDTEKLKAEAAAAKDKTNTDSAAATDYLASLRGGGGGSSSFGQSSLSNTGTQNISDVRDTLGYMKEVSSENKKNQDDAIRAELVRIPLHPLDRHILTQPSYNRPLKRIMYPAVEASDLAGSFGNISYIPDEFGYSNFSEEEKGFIKEKEISIFRYNTTNPNVLDLKFKFGGVYLGQLEMGFQKMVNRRASNVATGVLPMGTGSFPITTPGDAAAFLRLNNYSNNMGDEDRDKLLQELTRRMSPELAASVASDPNLGANFVAFKLDEARTKDLQGYIEIEQMLPGKPNQLMTEFAEGMYREALNLNITTLPSFHLSKAVLGFPCVLFAQDQAILQSQQPTRTPLNSFFSGLYKVMGFKHTINATTCKSEFKLTKNAVRYDIEEANRKSDEFFRKVGIANEEIDG